MGEHPGDGRIEPRAPRSIGARDRREIAGAYQLRVVADERLAARERGGQDRLDPLRHGDVLRGAGLDPFGHSLGPRGPQGNVQGACLVEKILQPLKIVGGGRKRASCAPGHGTVAHRGRAAFAHERRRGLHDLPSSGLPLQSGGPSAGRSPRHIGIHILAPPPSVCGGRALTPVPRRLAMAQHYQSRPARGCDVQHLNSRPARLRSKRRFPRPGWPTRGRCSARRTSRQVRALR